MNRAVNIYVDAVARGNDVLGEGIVGLVRAIPRSIARLYRSVQMHWRRRAWIGKLNALNDHLLRDIGLTRHEIPVYVKQYMTAHAVPSERPSLVQRAGQAVRATQRPFKTWRDARITARQLRRLDRRLLADIDLQSSDIGWLVRDLAERSLATATAADDNRDRTAA